MKLKTPAVTRRSGDQARRNSGLRTRVACLMASSAPGAGMRTHRRKRLTGCVISNMEARKMNGRYANTNWSTPLVDTECGCIAVGERCSCNQRCAGRFTRGNIARAEILRQEFDGDRQIAAARQIDALRDDRRKRTRSSDSCGAVVEQSTTLFSVSTTIFSVSITIFLVLVSVR